jgi:autotransporter passenger strand-loop-strand repeat protein
MTTSSLSTVSSSLTISNGNTLDVASGGVAVGTVIDGGRVIVLSGGVTSGSIVSSAGTSGIQWVSSGGSANSTTVLRNAKQYVMNGGTATDTVVSSGGRDVVSSGGVAISTTASSGGFETVSNGGQDSGLILLSGGSAYVSVGGSAVGTEIGSGAALYVYGGGTVSDVVLQSGGVLDLTYLVYSSGGTSSFDSATDQITVTEGASSQTILLSGTYTADSFAIVVDGGGGTVVELACFGEGTRIATIRGEVPIEQLREGDRAVLAAGGTREIVWIGHRSIEISRQPNAADIMPVCVLAGAFGEGLPTRDLLLSPDHAVFADGVLIPVMQLVNGTSIRKVQRDRISYWHVELDGHDVILAEGLAVESFLENGNRDSFEGDGPMRLHPAFRGSGGAAPCAAIVRHGPALDRVRARIDGVAAVNPSGAARSGG